MPSGFIVALSLNGQLTVDWPTNQLDQSEFVIKRGHVRGWI